MSLLRRLDRKSKGQEGDRSVLSSTSRRRGGLTGARGSKEGYSDLMRRIQSRLLQELDPSISVSDPASIRQSIRELLDQILQQEGIVLSRAERQRLFDQIAAEILGFGPLQPLLEDDSITEIMVNGPKSVYVERGGKLYKTSITFEDDEHVMRIIERIVAPLGRRVDEASPYVDARLPDGSRVNIVIPPISLEGPVITIRKFYRTPLTVEDLIRFGSITPEVMQFLEACVKARLNIIVAGGTGSGKTTLLNILSGFIPNDERIITIENAAELQLRQEHVVRLESRPPNIEGEGEITIRDLVINSLRMRPDRIIVGEVRGGEALDMLQAMNTGHEGSMTTLHSNSPRDTLARLETMVLMAGMDLPTRAIREQIASAIDLIVYQSRMRDGSRKVVAVSEIAGMEGDVISMTDLFVFEHGGYRDGKVHGKLRPTGLRPKFMDKIRAAGIYLPPRIFAPTQQRS